MNNPQEQYNKEVMAFQESNIFPVDLIPEWFQDKVKVSMQFHCPSQLQVTVEQFGKLFNHTGDYNLYEMGLLLNIMESKSMKNLEMDIDLYMDYQHKISIMATAWSNLMNPELVKLKRKYETMQKLGGNPGITVPLGKA